MSQLPDGLIAFGPLANCTLDLCPLEWSILRYQPIISANAVFIAVFGLSLLIHCFQGWRSKTWGFAASMLSGCILEIIGYVGRLIIHDNPFSFNGFLMQISTHPVSTMDLKSAFAPPCETQLTCVQSASPSPPCSSAPPSTWCCPKCRSMGLELR